VDAQANNGRSRSKRRQLQGSNGIPPPPLPPKLSLGGTPVPGQSDVCPLCGNVRLNPVVCAVSGYVFCYRCLLSHIRVAKSCPVTRLLCDETAVVKLFDEDATDSSSTA
jgi:peroxin-12